MEAGQQIAVRGLRARGQIQNCSAKYDEKYDEMIADAV